MSKRTYAHLSLPDRLALGARALSISPRYPEVGDVVVTTYGFGAREVVHEVTEVRPIIVGGPPPLTLRRLADGATVTAKVREVSVLSKFEAKDVREYFEGRSHG